ncbi:unnamed protein product [Mytilus edulis]|uniref:Uncharacterized protein n=1 Tax=Mytilus edulis TaxID=6550 RepID=A0A8S3ST23_MYTED|nr:unnamed protein product [Mytilus edulis]
MRKVTTAEKFKIPHKYFTRASKNKEDSVNFSPANLTKFLPSALRTEEQNLRFGENVKEIDFNTDIETESTKIGDKRQLRRKIFAGPDLTSERKDKNDKKRKSEEKVSPFHSDTFKIKTSVKTKDNVEINKNNQVGDKSVTSNLKSQYSYQSYPNAINMASALKLEKFEGTISEPKNIEELRHAAQLAENATASHANEIQTSYDKVLSEIKSLKDDIKSVNAIQECKPDEDINSLVMATSPYMPANNQQQSANNRDKQPQWDSYPTRPYNQNYNQNWQNGSNQRWGQNFVPRQFNQNFGNRGQYQSNRGQYQDRRNPNQDRRNFVITDQGEISIELITKINNVYTV